VQVPVVDEHWNNVDEVIILGENTSVIICALVLT